MNRGHRGSALTVSILDEIVERMIVAAIGELVIARRKLLETLRGNTSKIPGEFRVLHQNHRPPRHEAVDQRLLAHIKQ